MNTKASAAAGRGGAPRSPKTQDDYIASLPPGSRAIAERVRQLVHQAAPEATEAIKYGMPAFLIGGAAFLYFAVWKKHVGLYPIYAAPPQLEAKLAPYRHAKDTVRFPLTEPIDSGLVTLLVQFKRQLALGKAAKGSIHRSQRSGKKRKS